ncbi:hypothetical protein AYO40_01980 [Planctomycetaceae bacterium SCGC AG-212-D15]|nr:hypothetical protein AYO40_01980 [Planctomycetaceae bacterium SCGC AG-212-D15]
MKPVAKPDLLSAEQRLLLLDTWKRSGLPGADFATMVGVTKHTLYSWKRKFEEEGLGRLIDKPRGGPKGSRVHDLTKRTILMLKEANPDWVAGASARCWCADRPCPPVPPPSLAFCAKRAMNSARSRPATSRHFERARPNQLWQTDPHLRSQATNRRVYLVAFMDDHSRFIVSYGLHAASPRRWSWRSCARG